MLLPMQSFVSLVTIVIRQYYFLQHFEEVIKADRERRGVGKPPTSNKMQTLRNLAQIVAGPKEASQDRLTLSQDHANGSEPEGASACSNTHHHASITAEAEQTVSLSSSSPSSQIRDLAQAQQEPSQTCNASESEQAGLSASEPHLRKPTAITGGSGGGSITSHVGKCGRAPSRVRLLLS